MSDNQLEIVLSLDDQLTAGLQKASNQLEAFGQQARSVGRELDRVGTTLTFFGAGISAPFILALKNASKTSDDVQKSLAQLNAITAKLNDSIGKSLVSIVQTLTGALITLNNEWNKIDQATRDQIVQVALITGVSITFVGILAVIVGKLIEFIANIALLTGKFIAFIALNPEILVIAAALFLIGTALWQCKQFADIFFNTMQITFSVIKGLVLGLKLDFELFTAAIEDSIASITSTLGRIPGPSQQAFQGLTNWIKQGSQAMKTMAAQDMVGIQHGIEDISKILTTGTGDWAKNFDTWKQKISDVINLFKNFKIIGVDASTVVPKTLQENLKGVLSAVGGLDSALQGAAAQNKKFAEAAQIVSIGMAIANTAQGVTKAWAEYPFPYSAIVAGIVSAAGAVQIATIANQSFAVGTSSVPYDMTAQIHQGETIIPATFADAIRRGQLSLSGGGNNGGGGDMYIILNNPQFRNQSDARQYSELMGYEIQRKMRGARSNI